MNRSRENIENQKIICHRENNRNETVGQGNAPITWFSSKWGSCYCDHKAEKFFYKYRNFFLVKFGESLHKRIFSKTIDGMTF